MALDYATVIRRINAILKTDSVLKSKVKEFRFGEQTKDRNFSNMRPLVFTTISPRPELERTAIGPATATAATLDKVVNEFHVIVVTKTENKQEDTQVSAYELCQRIAHVLRRHVKLDLTDEPSLNIDTTQTSIHERYAQTIGLEHESMTVVVRTTSVDSAR